MGIRKSKQTSSPSKNELTENQIADICRHLNIVDNEVRNYYFNFIRQYPNGRITREQFHESLKEVWPNGHIDKFAFSLFSILDQDRNGTIDFCEYMKVTYRLQSKFDDNDERPIWLALIFDMFDRNHDGYLERNELKRLVESIYDITGLSKVERRGINAPNQQAKYLLEKLDQNQDKRLSKYEFMNENYWIDDERLSRLLLYNN